MAIPNPQLDDPRWEAGKLTTEKLIRVNGRLLPDTSARVVKLLEGIYDGSVKRWPEAVPADGHNWHLYDVQGIRLWAVDDYIVWEKAEPPIPPLSKEPRYYFDFLGRTYVINDETRNLLRELGEYIVQCVDKTQQAP